MENQNVCDDACNLEISMRPEPHLEASQDLELLAQEIAEAAVEEERRSSNASSPTPSQSQMSDVSTEMMLDTEELIDADKQEFTKAEEEEDEEEEDEEEEEEEEEEERVEEDEMPGNGNEERMERGRSQSPVDEASWEIVDAEEEPTVTGDDETMKVPEQNHCIVRKFLGSHDLLQKLKEVGMVCDICTDQQMDADDNSGGNANLNRLGGVNDLLVSCSESMVICDMPQDAEKTEDNTDEEEVQYPLPMRDVVPEDPNLPSWQGRIAGALVVVELERLGGLVVASVKVNHTDLLSALASLQQLAATAGLVSYADVDVQSILARAA